MTKTRITAIAIIVAAGFGLAGMGSAAAASPHHQHKAAASNHGKAGVRYAGSARQGGYQPLVSDGYGSGFGFHRNPGRFRVGAAIERDRQRAAVKSAVLDDAIGSQPDGYGFLGDSVYGEGGNAAYGVYNGADGYGSPYFAGFYGPGDGPDYGVLGHGYAN